MNEIRLFPVCDHKICLSTALACFWLSIVLVLSFLSLPNLSASYCPLLFLTILSRISVLLACFLLACLLAYLLTFSHRYRHRLYRYCFSLFSNSVFSIFFLILSQCFPFCLSLIILPFLISFLCLIFLSLHIFSSVDPIFYTKIANPFLLFLSTFHSLDYSFQRLMNLACSWNI